MMRANLASALFLGLALLAGVASDAAAKQLAVVIGNDAYLEVTPLNAAVNDARAMGEGLRHAGFDVAVVENGTKRQISRALADVESLVNPGDTVVFHFSGHGFEIDGQNWLLPIDVPAAREGEAGLVKDASFNAADVIERFRARGAGTIVAILDACRNNPFAHAGSRALGGGARGLAQMDASGGVFILFSAGSKQEALDRLSVADPAKTSIFVRSFLPLLDRPDLSLIDIAKETQEKVRELARSVGHEQVPAYYDGIVGRVTLTGAPAGPRVAAPQPDPSLAAQARNTVAEETFWKSVADSNQPQMLEAYLEQVRRSVFVGTYSKLAESKLLELRSVPRAQERPPVAPAQTASAQASASAGAPDVRACDAVAADPRDPDRPADAPGVAQIAPPTAIATSPCAKAASGDSAPRRVFYQLSRVYEASGSDADAVRFLQRASDLGHPLALVAMADRNFDGRGTPRDPVRAMTLYYKAADAGVTSAIVKIGAMYANGQGAQRDYKKAVAFYNLALKTAEPSVFPDLGLLYLNGRGVDKDKRKACDLFKQGATLGNAQAAKNAASYCTPG
jgi:TPR repeat protein